MTPCAPGSSLLSLPSMATLGDTRPLVARPAGTIHSLPDDLLLLIISFVDVRDILSLRKTSKHLYAMSKLRWVWSDAMKRHIIDKGLPVPAADADLKAFSAEHLEARAVHAAKFHDNWCSPEPRPRRTLEFNADCSLPDEAPESHRSAINKVFFLPGRNGEFLITVSSRVITCWELPLDGSGAYRIAEWVSETRIEQVVVNDDAKSEAVLAYVTPQSATQQTVKIVVLSLDVFHGSFQPRALVCTFRHTVMPLHLMQGDYVIFGDPLFAWFYKRPAKCVLLSRLPVGLFPEESNKVLTVKVVNRYVIVARERTVQLMYAPLWKGEHMDYSLGVSACVHFDFRSKAASVVARIPIGEELADWPSEPVTILMRCCSDGLDVLEQIDLLPDPKVRSEPEAGPSTGQHQVAFELPCVLPYGSTKTVVLPPSACKLHVGPSGKGFWIQTRNVTSRRSVYPARCLAGFYVSSSKGQGKGVAPTGHKDGIGSENGGARPTPRDGNVLHECGLLYSRRCDMSEIIWRKYLITTAALEDTVGRIAIGDRTGRVEVLDFV